MSRGFLVFGTLCLLAGMAWGIVMSATQDHALSPAHAHLNLIGFVLSSIFGLYYALTPAATRGAIVRVHLGLHVLAVLVMIPGIVMAIQGTGEALAKGGSVLAVLSALVFLVQVARFAPGKA